MLLCDGNTGEFAHEGVELRGLLVLGLLTGIVEGARFDTRIDGLEGRACLAGSQYTFAAPYSYNGHLQTRQWLMRVGGQVAGQSRSRSEASVGLVSAAEDVLYQFVSNQTGVVVALHIVIVLNDTARGEQVIGELADDWCAQQHS